MTHDELAEDLAAHLRGNTGNRVWLNLQMGSSGSPRPDVWCMPCTYSKFTPVSYEVKVSVADFRRDVTAGKWQAYMQFSAGVCFAVPHGLIGPKDVPPGTGLITLTAGGWKHSKRPTLRHVENLPVEVWQKLVIDGVERAFPAMERNWVGAYTASKRAREKLGAAVMKVVEDTQRAELYLEQTRRETVEQQAKSERRLAELQEEFKAKWELYVAPGAAALMRELGVEPGANALHNLSSAIRVAREQLAVHPVLQRAHGDLSRARSSLERLGETLERAMAETKPPEVERPEVEL